MNRLESFSQNANPLITQLHPSARLLSANLKQVAKVAPDFNSFFIGLRKLAKRSMTGLPSLQTLLDTDLPPLLTEITPFLEADHPDRRRGRPLSERRHRLPRQRRRRR